MRETPARTDALIYGRNAVREALRGKRRVREVMIVADEDGQARAGLERSVREWASEAGGAVPRISSVSGRELAERVHTTEHQGVVATVDAYPYADVSRLLEECSLFVALDGIEDPHNLGAVVRSAEAAGAGVVIARHRAAEITAAVVKSSAGATEHAAIAQVRNLSDFLTDAKGKGFWIYGAAAGAESDYTTQDYKYPTCFVLGSEGRGLGRRVASLCDVIISMPLLGRVESLNVSVSAGILLYEALRQRRSSGENGRLPG